MNSPLKIILTLLVLLIPLKLMAQSGESDYRDKQTIDAAFKAELATLGFENGEYPELEPLYTIKDKLIQLPAMSAIAPDGSILQGAVPNDVSTEDVVRASAFACAASINQLKMAAGGDLSRIQKIANIRYKTLTIPEYFDYIPASNSCSQMMLKVFGRFVGAHTRHAEGQIITEGNQTFQIEMQVYLK